MGQIKLTISLVMIGLFTIAILGFAINFAIDNDASISINQDSEVSDLYSKSQGNISGFSDDSEDTYQSILETTIEEGGSTAPSTAPFALTTRNALGTTKNIVQVGYQKIFGTGAGFGIFITTFIGLLTVIFGLYIYKTLKGNP